MATAKSYTKDGATVVTLASDDGRTPIDTLTDSRVGINLEHSEIHAGHSFISDIVDLDMDAGDTIILAFKTTTGAKRAHMFIQFSTLVGGDLALWEGATWTTNTGTAHPIYNRKRLASMTSSGILEDKTATPTFTATDNILLNVTGLGTGSATRIHHLYAWGRKEKFSGGNVRDENEQLLKPDTQYAVVFTSADNSNKAQVILNWYEHTDSA